MNLCIHAKTVYVITYSMPEKKEVKKQSKPTFSIIEHMASSCIFFI